MEVISVKCAMCATDKHPSLMRSTDTCNDCAERSRPCHNCTGSSVAKSWVNGICPKCGFCHDKALEHIDYDDRVKAMVIVTDASVARKTVIETLGFARGSTVRAKHVGSDIMAGLKSVVGGELKGYTELLANGREEAIYRLKQDASKLGADAVISMRLTTSMIAVGAVEIMAYGTAVKFAEEV